MARRLARSFTLLVSAALCASLLVGLGLSASAAPALGTTPGASATGSWGTAEPVPALAALNVNGYAQIATISCVDAGDCAAAGYYQDGTYHQQAFLVDETNGTWGNAEEVPGTATLGSYSTQIDSISCTKAGDCAAGGSYNSVSNGSSAQEPFVVDETNGTWGNADEVPAMGTLNADGYSQVSSISCISPGNCAAGGFYSDGLRRTEAFVVDETNGTWGNAEEVPGTPALNAYGNYAVVNSVSCVSPGDCVAGGSYDDGTAYQAFVVDEVDRSWGNAEEVAGIAALNVDRRAATSTLSCASPGDCAAGGYYVDGSNLQQAFVVDEVDGNWGSAEEVPGTATLNAGTYAGVLSVSCLTGGNCAAGGYYQDSSDHNQAFVVDETSGKWGSAEEVPGTTTLNADGSGQVSSVSCTAVGYCAAGGYGRNVSGIYEAFVDEEANGVWGNAEEVPGVATLNVGTYAAVNAISCAPTGVCAAGGVYQSSSQIYEAFVVDYTPPAPTVSRVSPASGPFAGGTLVTLTGANLFAPNTVDFGTTAAKIVAVVSATEVQVTAPKGRGTINVTATTAGGTSDVGAGNRYNYIQLPTVTRLSPAEGPAAGGTSVTITGTNLLAPSSVHFGAAVAKIDAVSATQIKVTAPKGAGTVYVTVTTAGGTSSKTAVARYRYSSS